MTVPAPTSPPALRSPPTRAPLIPTSPSTESEIARELSSVRSIRRRSGSVGQAGAFDPDLPPPTMTAVQSTLDGADGIVPQQNLHSTPSASTSSSTEGSEEEEDQSQLFWVPAHLHPELAPGEFRAFLKEHAHAHALQSDTTQQSTLGSGSGAGQGGLTASSSAPAFSSSSSSSSSNPPSPFQDAVNRGGSLGRKRSMLSKQYTPRANDGVENEMPVGSLHRARTHRSSIYSSALGTDEDPGVSLVDLQKLEELADEAAKSNDPAKLRTMLRRSWSIGGHSEQANIDTIDGVGFDENDAPVIAMRPGSPSLIRRTARTKIRKAGVEGDAAHRFGPSRRGRTAHLIGDNALTFDTSDSHLQHHPSSEEGGGHSSSSPTSPDSDSPSKPPLGMDDSFALERPVSITPSLDDSSIYESYINSRDSYNSQSSNTSLETGTPSRSESPSPPNLRLSLPSLRIDEFEPEHIESQTTPTQEQPNPIYLPSSVSETSLLSSSNERHSPPTSPEPRSSGAPSPEPSERAVSPQPAAPTLFPPGQQPKMERSESSSSAGSSFTSREKEKEKKGGFFSSKKDKDKKKEKEKEKEKGKLTKSGHHSSSEKEKPFFGSLFGSKKKAHEEPPSTVNAGDGRLAAAALLKTAKSPSPGPPSPTSGAFSNFARYPIHVERAVYRLSHIKLANPRRPLYEQVLISNLMFWYLSIINKAQNAGKEGEKVEGKKEEGGGGSESEGEKVEKPKAAPVKGTPSGNSSQNPYINGSTPPTSPAAKRTSLTKKEDPRAARPAPRSAETPVRTPQYGVQNAQIDKEYSPQQQQQQQQHREREPRPPPPANLAPPQNSQQQQPPSREPRRSPPPQQQQQQQLLPQRQPSYPGSSSSGPPNQRGPPPERDPRAAPPPLYGGPPIGSGPTPPPQFDSRVVSNGAYPYSPGPPQQQHGAPPPSQSKPTSPPHLANPPMRRGASEQAGGSPYPSQPMQRIQTDGQQHPSPRAQPGPGQIFQHPNGQAQPGQVFRHPSGSGGPPSPGGIRPGEVFNPNLLPQIGQVFHHQQGGYRPPPMRPGPPLQQQGGRPPPGPPGQQPYPYPPQQYPPNHPNHPSQQQHHARPPPPGPYQQQQGGPVRPRSPPPPGGYPPQNYGRPPPPSQPQFAGGGGPPAGYYGGGGGGPPPQQGHGQQPHRSRSTEGPNHHAGEASRERVR